MTQAERDAYSFAETVRKLAISIVANANAENLDAVKEAGLSLMQQAIQQKKTLEAAEPRAGEA